MGSPGAGKTTVGRILGHHLGKDVIDVDDDACLGESVGNFSGRKGTTIRITMCIYTYNIVHFWLLQQWYEANP